MRLALTLRSVTGLCLILGCSSLSAQDFSFGTDLVDGVETGRARGGSATAYMNFAISGNQLTAVLRNTSPDAENFGGNNLIGSPAVRRFDFDVLDVAGDGLAMTGWELSAQDNAGSTIVLGNESGGGANSWRMVQRSDSTFRIKSRGAGTPQGPLYNPDATGGFAAGTQYFTDAVFTATFNATIGASDLNPEIRFKYLGVNGIGKSLTGVPLSSTVNPEPGSILVWSGLLAAAGYRCRRKRRRR